MGGMKHRESERCYARRRRMVVTRDWEDNMNMQWKGRQERMVAFNASAAGIQRPKDHEDSTTESLNNILSSHRVNKMTNISTICDEDRRLGWPDAVQCLILPLCHTDGQQQLQP